MGPLAACPDRSGLHDRRALVERFRIDLADRDAELLGEQVRPAAAHDLVNASAMNDPVRRRALVANEVNASAAALAHDLGSALARDDALPCREALAAAAAR